MIGIEDHAGPSPQSAVLFGRSERGAIAEVRVVGPDASAVAVGVGAGVRPEWWPAFGLEPVPAADVAGEPLATSTQVDLAAPWSADRVESDLGLFTVEHLTDWVAVHSALVRIDGVVLALPGPSHAGKSTLCGAVLEAGGEVLSDEYALVAADARLVRGWPRRVRLRGGLTRPRRVGMALGGEVPQVDLIALVAYEASCEAPLEVTTLPPAELVTGVLANTVCAASRPRFAFDAVVAWCRSVPGVAGRRGEAEAALRALVERARDSAPGRNAG